MSEKSNDWADFHVTECHIIGRDLTELIQQRVALSDQRATIREHVSDPILSNSPVIKAQRGPNSDPTLPNMQYITPPEAISMIEAQLVANDTLIENRILTFKKAKEEFEEHQKAIGIFPTAKE